MDERPNQSDRNRDPDEALMARARAGDRAALGELLSGHEQMLFAICLRTVGDREAARDMTQDAMVKAIQSLESFDGRSRFGTWLTRIAINSCLSHLRKQRLRKHASLDVPAGSGSGRGGGPGSAGPSFVSTLPGVEPEPGSRVETDETLATLDRAMALIDPEQRVLLTLRDVRDLDYAQIAEALDVPIGTVKSRLFRARAALREAMEQAGSAGPAKGASPERGHRDSVGKDQDRDRDDERNAG